MFIAKFDKIWGKNHKKGLHLKIYANFHEFWGEAAKTNGLHCKIYEKTVLAHEFRVITSILGLEVLGLRLHSSSTEPVTFFGTQSSLGGRHNSRLGGTSSDLGARPWNAPSWRRAAALYFTSSNEVFV